MKLIENEEKMLQLLLDSERTMEAVEKAKKDFKWSRKHSVLSRISGNFNFFVILSIINTFVITVMLLMNISLVDGYLLISMISPDDDLLFILIMIELAVDLIIKLCGLSPNNSGRTWLDYLSAEDVLKINEVLLEAHTAKKEPVIYIRSQENGENEKLLWKETSKPVTHRIICIME